MDGLKRFSIAALLLALVAAACSTASATGAGSEELDNALTALNEAVRGLNATTAEIEATLHDLETRVVILENSSQRLALDIGRVGPSRAVFLPQPPEGLVTVQFVAEALNGAIPGTFRFFLAPEGEQLFETHSLAPDETFEVGPELEDGIVFVEPGVLYMLKIVYENPTSEEIQFLVPGGTLDPQAALPYVRNRCWCASLPYTVPASGTFTRVIQVGVGPDTPAGARAVVVWPVVRLEG